MSTSVGFSAVLSRRVASPAGGECVIGIPSQHYGEEVMAWVRLREGTNTTPAQLVAACRGRIATYKIPRYWKFVDSFPMTVTGKTQKYRMREIAIEELAPKAAA